MFPKNIENCTIFISVSVKFREINLNFFISKSKNNFRCRKQSRNIIILCTTYFEIKSHVSSESALHSSNFKESFVLEPWLDSTMIFCGKNASKMYGDAFTLR